METAIRNARSSIDVLTGPWDDTLRGDFARAGPQFPPPGLLLNVGRELRLRYLFITNLKPQIWERYRAISQRRDGKSGISTRFRQQTLFSSMTKSPSYALRKAMPTGTIK